MADSGLDSVDKGSPGLRPFHPKIKYSPSPPPDISPSKRMPSTTNNHEGVGPGGTRATSGDAVLIGYLGDGKNPEIARSASEEDLPPDLGDKDDPMKNVTVLGSQAPENPNPTLKRLRETALGAPEEDDIENLPPAKRGVAYQPDNKIGDGHLNERSSTEGLPLVIYDDTHSSGEVS